MNKSLFDCDDMSYSIQIVFTKLFTDIQRVIVFSFRAIGLDLKCFKLQRVIKEKKGSCLFMLMVSLTQSVKAIFLRLMLQLYFCK